MQSITITIDTSNDSFQPIPTFQLSEILEQLARNLLDMEKPTTIKDTNGNTVGSIQYDMCAFGED